MFAASLGLASKECGSATVPVTMEVTVAWPPATALATLPPHTSVEATTFTEAWSLSGGPFCSCEQPATATVSRAAAPAATRARIHIS